jgi:hypothetical protein
MIPVVGIYAFGILFSETSFERFRITSSEGRFFFPRGVGAWSLAARGEARQGRIPNCAVVAEDESA